jgi:hypothetical protein
MSDRLSQLTSPYVLCRADDRRQLPRYRCKLKAEVAPYPNPDQVCWHAEVADLSTGGFALLFCPPLRRGAIIHVRIRPAGHPGFLRRLARVRHVRSDDAHGSCLGCSVVNPLEAEELQWILGWSAVEPATRPQEAGRAGCVSTGAW